MFQWRKKKIKDDPEIVDFHTNLFESIEKGDLNQLKTLLTTPFCIDDHLCDVYVLSGRCTRKPTLLIIAASFLNFILFNFLLVKVQIQIFQIQRYPIHFAAMKGNIDVLRSLIQAKAEVNKQDWDDLSPLHYCAISNFVNGAEALLDAGAAINIQNRLKETPLILAVKNSHFEMVDFLLNARADYKRPSHERRGPLFHVTDANICALLIKAGCVLNEKDDNGLSPLHVAVQRGLVEVAKVMIENGANVNDVDLQKQTPLHIAANNGNDVLAELLLSNHAELKILDNERRNPEMLARRGDHFQVLNVISRYMQSKDSEETPLLSFKPFTGMVDGPSPPTDGENNQSESQPQS